MEDDTFDEAAFFAAILRSGARTLLIGRRALVLLGLPLLTADYDLWAHPDDLAILNIAAEPFGFAPTHAPEEARQRGRYALEDGERVDVLVARSVRTVDGVEVAFDDLWARRASIWIDDHVWIHLPDLDDLILTKRFAARPKDVADIRLLQALRASRETR